MYLLPDKQAKDILSMYRRKLFIRPEHLMHKEMNTIRCKAGTVIFRSEDISKDVFYIVHGNVKLDRNGSSTSYSKGCFFGELSCILNKEHGTDAYAVTDSVLIRISGTQFRELLEQDPGVAAKALSQISDYFSQFYGRTEGFLV